MKKGIAAIMISGTIGALTMLYLPVSQAGGFGPMNMMNPGKWMGKNRNRNNRNDYYEDDYYGGGPGYGGPNRGGYGSYQGQPNGYGGPGYGSGSYQGQPYGQGYGAPASQAPAAISPQATEGATAERMREMEDRIRMLESQLRNR